MQIIFTTEDRWLLKGLKIEYLQFNMMMKRADLKTMMRKILLEMGMVSFIMKSLID